MDGGGRTDRDSKVETKVSRDQQGAFDLLRFPARSPVQAQTWRCFEVMKKTSFNRKNKDAENSKCFP